MAGPMDRLETLLERFLAEQREQRRLLTDLQADVGRAVRVHLEDRVGARQWQVSGLKVMGPATSVEVLRFTPPQNYPWRLQQLGLCGDRWDDPTGTRGLSYSLRRGEAAEPFFVDISFPWGSIEQRGDIYLVGNGAEPFSLFAVNNDAVDTLTITAAAVGVCYSVEHGGA